MKAIKALILCALTGILIGILDRPLPLRTVVLPPLGRLLDPVNGFWANAESAEALPQLKNRPGRPYLASVQVIYDRRRVPHIFAQNDPDLFRAQGYVTAADRLWQMDFQTAAAAGRLSEFLYHIAGDKVVEFDRLKRRTGMVLAAQRTLKFFEKDSLARKIVESFTEGVNDYIRQLGYRDLPLEYKILDYRPQPWTPLKCALLLKYMAEMLTNDENDLQLTEAVSILGREYVDLLFPVFPDTLLEPIVPTGVPLRDCPVDESSHTQHDVFHVSRPSVRPTGVPPSQQPELGSNNWAVAGSRTRSGRPILCGDPHLSLNLPALWYEIHLNAPGLNVYGVSLPGAPGVVIGFNDHIAWSMTNAMRDVRDWYSVRYTSPARNTIWMDDGQEKVYLFPDTILRRGAPPLIDTLRLCRWGPVVYDREFPHPVFDTLALALRWTAHYPGGELLTVYHINRARNLQDFLKGLKYFSCPAQNFVYADKEGNIGLFQQGLFPAFSGEPNRLIRNGATKSEEWPSWLNFGCNPSIVNPSWGFVYSANQHPTTPDYPWTYTGDFEFFRNHRIHNLLQNGKDFTPENIQAIQLDNLNLLARWTLPLLMDALEKDEAQENALIPILKSWNYENSADSEAPGLFQLWFEELEKCLWDEVYRRNPACLPQEFYTLRFLQKFKDHPWYDVDSTPNKKESREDVIRMAFQAMKKRVKDWSEKHPGKKPLWYLVKNTSLKHLLPALEAFGISGLRIGGGRHIVNACGPRWGPSWRMIVSLEDPVWAYGIFPGGPSGNPGSPWYTSSAEDWAAGRYYKITLTQSPEDSLFKGLKRLSIQ
ncbi:MAG: penicillin acylase family protein [Flavobacteriales bacterium]|nr:penicillin acylase family protein [Flavobacteriales bacterium]MDW8432134.1 penicillin acylase family protein [Flavobacteriales bacterium]